MNVIWSRQQVKQARKRKLLEAEVGSVEGFPERFVLYGSGVIQTMWSLHDRTTETTYFLYGMGWEEARKAAELKLESEL